MSLFEKNVYHVNREIDYEKLANAILSAEEKKEKKEQEDFKAKTLPLKNIIGMIFTGVAIIIFVILAIISFISKDIITGAKFLLLFMTGILFEYTIYIMGKSANRQLLLSIYSILIAMVSLVISVLKV